MGKSKRLTMTTMFHLNSLAAERLRRCDRQLAALKIARHGGVYDFGIATPGSLAAGIALAEVATASLARVSIGPPDRGRSPRPLVCVQTDAPVEACMASQYAGWPVQTDKYFAMGSGPMRAKRGREAVLEELNVSDPSPEIVGVLEGDTLPGDSVVQYVAQEAGGQSDAVLLAIAPTTSLAGAIQIVARSVETAMHKLHSLGGDLRRICCGVGSAVLPVSGGKFLTALGRTNDAILYGAEVTLWTDDPEQLDLIERLPSCASRDWGRPFAAVFADYGHDFYKVDAALFAPAVITLIDVVSGESRTAGEFRPDLLK